MKKFLLLVIVLAVAVVAGLPPVAGKVARDQISASLEQASDNGFIVFGLKDFDSGWMNSSGHIEVRFSDQYIETLSNIATSNPDADNEEIAASVADALDESILLDIELSHGPVMLDDGSFIGWSKAVVRINPQDEELLALKDELGIPYFLEIRTQTGFDGTTAFNANIPAMNYLAEVGDFRFSGFELDGTFDGTNLSTEGGTESFSVYGPGIQMEMTNFSFSSKQTMYPPHLWLGITEGSIESTAMHSVNDPNATGVEMHDIRFSSETSLNESPDQVDLGINYSVASMTGPEIDLSDMKIGVHIRQLDIDSVMHYYELNRDMVLVDPNALEERMPELTALAYKALAKSPSIALDPVSFKWNQDAFEASVRLDINGEKLPSEENWDPLNTMAWSAMTSVTAESRIDENLALEIATETLRQQLLAQSSEANPITPEQAVEMARLQAPAMLEMLTLQGLLTRTETGYAVRASFEDSTLTLNGKPIPLGAGMP